MAERSKTTRILLLGALALGGCADQEESLIVLHSPAWDDQGSCTVDPGSDTALALGLLDVSEHTPFMLPMILQNQLVSDDNPSNGIDNGEMRLRSADVTLTLDQDPSIIDALEAIDPALVDFSVSLPTISLPSESRQGVLIEVISRRASEALDAQVIALGDGSRPTLTAHVVFHARRTGNSVGGLGDVESREYAFPIQLCSGCLRVCTTCAGGQCPVDAHGVVGGVCGNAQDLPYAPYGCTNPLDQTGS